MWVNMKLHNSCDSIKPFLVDNFFRVRGQSLFVEVGHNVQNWFYGQTCLLPKRCKICAYRFGDVVSSDVFIKNFGQTVHSKMSLAIVASLLFRQSSDGVGILSTDGRPNIFVTPTPHFLCLVGLYYSRYPRAGWRIRAYQPARTPRDWFAKSQVVIVE